MNKITDSHIYQSMDGGTSTKIKTLIGSKNLITMDNCNELHYVLSTNPKGLIDPNGMRNALKNGMIRIVYEPHVSLGRSVAFIPVGEGSSAICIINGNTFFKTNTEVTANGEKITYKENNSNLSGIIELLNMAHITLNVAKKPIALYNNIAIREIVFELYHAMIGDTLTRLTSISSNPVGLSLMKVLMSCMLIKRMGITDMKNVCQYFINKEGIEDVHANIIINSLTDDKIDNMETVLDTIKLDVPQLSKVDLPSLISAYTTNFTPMAPISMDYAPYLAAMIVSGATGCVTVGFGFNKRYKREVTIGSQIISKYFNSVM